ncbi:hypothetical protein MMC30_006653 [Trapelia coarctata]|nr:hypothetical protein [Trapelia coarctata]
MENHYKAINLKEETDSECCDVHALGSSDALLGEDGHILELSKPARNKRGYLITLTVHVLVLCFYLSWTVTLLKTRQSPVSCEPGPDLIYSPAREAVKYETVLMNNSVQEKGPFKGDPRPEKTEAWRQYGQWQFIRASAEDLKSINRSALELSDGSGEFLVTLDVFHELHCLNMIREYIHQDYYPSGETPAIRWKHVGKFFPNTLFVSFYIILLTLLPPQTTASMCFVKSSSAMEIFPLSLLTGLKVNVTLIPISMSIGSVAIGTAYFNGPKITM